MDAELGRRVYSVAVMLHEIWQQTISFVNALDKVLADRQWQMSQRQVMRPEEIRLRTYRIYAPVADDQHELLLLHIGLMTPRPFEQPTCLLAHASGDSALDEHEVWNKWNSAGTDRIYSAVGSYDARSALPDRLFPNFCPGARSCSALVVPLCELSNEDDILRRALTPLLPGAGT